MGGAYGGVEYKILVVGSEMMISLGRFIGMWENNIEMDVM
jgi:hypothetical protein